jgi:transcriptional regulator
MYQPAAHREDRVEVLHALIRAHPLGLLISGGAAGLDSNPVPFVVDAGPGPFGRLRAHLARPNPQWRALAEDGRCLVVFQGPEAYVTPSWYPSKRDHGKVVPTWNYAIVEARGRARIVEDEAWLRRQIDDLTALRETGRPDPWAVSDAPAPFVGAMLRGIVGLEVELEALAGKWKVSQNRPEADRRGVAEGLAAEGGADAMARLVGERDAPASG